jgi:hypothetical protein
MAAPFSLDKLLRYGPTVLDAAGQAWDRVRKWRSARESTPAHVEPAHVEPKEREEGSLSLQQLTQAVASQSELVRQLAEQANGMTNALSELASRVARVEEQNKQQLARMRGELASQAARSRWAMTIAGLSIVLAGLLAVFPYLGRYF